MKKILRCATIGTRAMTRKRISSNGQLFNTFPHIKKCSPENGFLLTENKASLNLSGLEALVKSGEFIFIGTK